jgi:hypothetical protein
MLEVVVGHSHDPDTPLAIAEILADCQRQAPNQQPQAGILLAAIDFEFSVLLDHIFQAYPNLELIGGTTDGEMSSILGFEQDSVSLMLFYSDDVVIRAGLGEHLSQDVAGAVNQAIASIRDRRPVPPAERAIAHLSPPDSTPPNSTPPDSTPPDSPLPDPAEAPPPADPMDAVKLCIALPESLNTSSAAAIIQTINQVLKRPFPLLGGLTADQWRFQQSYQFFGTSAEHYGVYSDALPLLAFAGNILCSYGVASGWVPIGQTGVITEVQGNVVYKIDDQSALQFYENYLGSLPPSSDYPLAVYDDEEQYYYMRAPSGQFDAETGSITFFGDVPAGAIVRLAEATRDRILLASQASMRQALNRYPDQETPAAALFFSCASRRQLLGTRTQEEYKYVMSCLSKKIPTCGFYTNGEIAPLEQPGWAYFHNETFVTVLLGTASDEC